MTTSGWLRRSVLPLIAVTTALCVAGCSSDQPDHRSGEHGVRSNPTPPLAGQEIFFNGQILAEVKVGKGAGFDRKADKAGDEPGSEPRKHGGGGGGFRMGGMGGGGGGGHRHHDNGGEPGSEAGDMPSQIERERTAAMRHAANLNPPVMIHLRFTNQGPNHADLLIADFLSPLGNFVVEPEKLSLEPGQTLEVEPMTSRLAGEISGATVTLALRLDGRGEKKDVILSLVPAPEPSAASAEPAPAGK